MKRGIFFKLLLVIFSVVLILWVLMFLTPMPNQKSNGFSRRWISTGIQPLKQIATSLPLEKICGATDHHLFLTLPNPQWVIMLDQNLQRQDTIFFPIEPKEDILVANSFAIDSPWVFFFANNLPGYVYGELKGNKVEKVKVKLTKSLFTRAINIDPTKVVIRAIDSIYNKQIFRKLDNNTENVAIETAGINDQKDAGFSTDGILLYDNATHQIVYLLHYRNQFLSLDTNLNTKLIARTIDTVEMNDLQIEKVLFAGKDRLMPMKPRVMVNKGACVDNGLLFVLSGLRADNERLREFIKNSVVDIYEVSDGKYKGSFYIPHFKGEKVKSIRVRNGLLYVLYERYISTFSLTL